MFSKEKRPSDLKTLPFEDQIKWSSVSMASFLDLPVALDKDAALLTRWLGHPQDVEKINAGGQASKLEKLSPSQEILEETKFGQIYGGYMFGDILRDAQVMTNYGLQILLKTLPDDLKNSGHCLKFALTHDGTVYLSDPAQHRILVGKPE